MENNNVNNEEEEKYKNEKKIKECKKHGIIYNNVQKIYDKVLDDEIIIKYEIYEKYNI